MTWEVDRERREKGYTVILDEVPSAIMSVQEAVLGKRG